jgi:NTP pyrophosphatase (non-canonical NTP hydrolase)
MQDLQKLVADFNKKHGFDVSLSARLLDLCSETGEVAKLGFKSETTTPPDTAKWNEELGDALFSLLCLFNHHQLDASEALKTVLAKYESRIQSKGSAESGS